MGSNGTRLILVLGTYSGTVDKVKAKCLLFLKGHPLFCFL